MDEFWGFSGKKEKHLRAGDDARLGDVWTSMPSTPIQNWYGSFGVLATVTLQHTSAFVSDVADRMRNRLQISTDGLKAYGDAIDAVFDGDDNPKRHVIVLHGHPITSAVLAVHASILQEIRANAPAEALRRSDAKLPKGKAKGRIVPIRFNAADIKRIESVAKANQKTVSEWIRGAIAIAMEAQ